MKITLLTQLCQNMASFERGLAFFTLAWLSLCCLCAKQKKKHTTRSEDLQTTFWPDPPPTRQPCLVSPTIWYLLSRDVLAASETPSFWGGKLLQNWALFEVDQRHLQLLCDVLSVLVYCPVCGLGVNQGNNQSEWGEPGRTGLTEQS